MKFTIKFSSWFSNCCLNDVEHPVYGKHQVTPSQISNSSKEYKDNLYKCMKNAYDNGDIDNNIIMKHS